VSKAARVHSGNDTCLCKTLNVQLEFSVQQGVREDHDAESSRTSGLRVGHCLLSSSTTFTPIFERSS
jgi:hypothetical protein